MSDPSLSRRQFLTSGSALATLLLVACAAPAAPTQAPAATVAPTAAAAAPTATIAAAAPTATTAPAVAPTATTAAAKPTAAATAQPTGLKSVPRNRTLMMGWWGDGPFVESDIWTAFAVGGDYQKGVNIMYEGLAYWNAFTDQEYMWQAESYQYTPDFTE